jgi:hypothetical protein
VNKVTLVIAIILLSKVWALEISDFKSGLMCGVNKADPGWVCFEKESIEITGQGSCLSGGKTLKCTWYGFSFDYKGNRGRKELDCEYSRSKPTYTMDYFESSDEPSSSGTYKIKLNGDSGYFVNPQFSVLNTSGSDNAIRISTSASCFSEGQKVFEYKFISVYPPSL